MIRGFSNVKSKHWEKKQKIQFRGNKNDIPIVFRVRKRVQKWQKLVCVRELVWWPGTKTIFDIKFVNTISFQSCINIYTHVWKMHNATDNTRPRRQSEEQKKNPTSNGHHELGQSCQMITRIHRYIGMHCTLHIISANNRQSQSLVHFVFVVWLHKSVLLTLHGQFAFVQTKIIVPFFTICKPNNGQKQTDKKRICSSNFIVRFFAAVCRFFVRYCCCQCSYTGLCAIKHRP